MPASVSQKKIILNADDALKAVSLWEMAERRRSREFMTCFSSCVYLLMDASGVFTRIDSRSGSIGAFPCRLGEDFEVFDRGLEKVVAGRADIAAVFSKPLE